MKVAYIGSWFDPPKAKEATLAQIEAGADLIFAERFGVFEAAKEKGVLAFGNMMDQHALAPEVVITGPVWNMEPTVRHSIDAVRNKEWKAEDLRGVVHDGPGRRISRSLPRVPAEASSRSDQGSPELEAKIMNGQFTVPVVETELKTD